MESELRCPVCNDYFVDPVMLQCTHHICMQHIGSVMPRDRLPCPVCSDVTAVPEGGLRVDRTLQVVVDMFGHQALPKQSDASGSTEVPPICGFCEEQPATRRCIQCAGVLCQDCEKSSHSKGFFKTHNIVDFDDTLASTPDYSTRMLCDDHPEEKLSFYCLDCRKPVCSHCLILGDHKNHQQTPIDQAFETGKETLSAWVEKLKRRMTVTEELREQLRTSELEVNRGAEAQRNIINHEMDHLRELIETKRHQLLSKSALEEKGKRVQLQSQMDRAEAAREDAMGLVNRSQDLLSLNSEHAFLAVVLPLIQDMKKCAGQPLDDAPKVSALFRPLSTDAQVRSLGDLDLGHPRPPPQQFAGRTHGASGGASIMQQQGHVAMDGHNTGYVPGAYNAPNATLSYLPQQHVPVQQAGVQYVYRTMAS